MDTTDPTSEVTRETIYATFVTTVFNSTYVYTVCANMFSVESALFIMHCPLI